METAIWMIICLGLILGGFLRFAWIAASSEKNKK